MTVPLERQKNIADVAPRVRLELGLGSAATEGVDSFATAAQGAKADSAIQAADLAAYATKDEVEGAAAGNIAAATWAQLVATPGTRVGQPGSVSSSDTGTHTDPVVGGTVPNGGEYRWSGSAWQRTGDIFNEETAATFFDVGIAGVFKALRPRPSFENGAVANIGDANRALGFTVPAGQTGQNTVLRYQLDIDDATAASLSNAQLHASFGFFLSATFDRTLNITINLWKKDGTVESITPTVLSNVVNGQFKVVTVEFASDVNTASIEFCATQSASSSVSSTQFAIMFNCMLSVVSTTAVPATVNSENASAGARLQSLAAIADIGPVWDDAATVGFIFAGAQFRLDASGRAIGWTIPAGGTGYNSLISVRIPVSESLSLTVQGSTIEWAFICRHSPGYSRGLTFVLANQEGIIATFMGRRQLISDTETLISGTGVVPAETTTLAASIQQATNTAAVSEEFLEIVDVRIFPVESADPVRPPARLASFWANSRQRDLGLSAVDHATVVDDIRPAAWTVDVAAGASINAALTTENPPAKGRRRKLRLAAGQYAENRIFPKMYDGLIGAGPDLTVIDGSLSANSALANIANDSTIESYYDADYYGLFVRARNCRYAAHTDLPSELKDVVQRWRNCVLIHEGNQDAIDYQVSLGPSGNPEGVWPSTYAWGVGIWSGWSLSAENCVFIGGAGASGGHNNLNFSKPGRISFRNCTLVARDVGGKSLHFGSLGAKLQSTAIIEGCSLTGDIECSALPWLQTTLDYQPADHHEFLLSGSGNTPAVFRIEDFGRALKIESAATAGTSTVSVSGNAVAVLFGKVVSKPGSGGIKGYAYGTFDISGRAIGPNYDLVITSLGKRLGDCTSASKTLTISINGGAGVNVIFNADYTDAANATILGMINAALGATATASEYAIGERYRPHFTDEERTLINGSDEGILMGMACSYDGDGSRYIRKATEDDAPSLFAGIAWEDIYPGGFGRVKTGGYLPISDLMRGDEESLAIGDGISVGPVDGELIRSESAPVLWAIRPDAISFQIR